jgi:hypothetical protein
VDGKSLFCQPSRDRFLFLREKRYPRSGQRVDSVTPVFSNIAAESIYKWLAIKSFEVFYARSAINEFKLELELIQTQMAQKPMLRAEVRMRVRCANKASAEWFRRERGIGQIPRKICKKRGICGCCALRRTIKRKARKQGSSWHAEHEVHSAEVKVCLSARKAPIVLPLSQKRPWQDRNSFLVRGVAVNRKAPPQKYKQQHASGPLVA